MSFRLFFTKKAALDLRKLEQDSTLQKQLKAVRKSLAYLEQSPRHPSLKTHEYDALTKQFGIKIFEAYAENKTPQAYRIFWHYGPGKSEITIINITPHP